MWRNCRKSENIEILKENIEISEKNNENVEGN